MISRQEEETQSPDTEPTEQPDATGQPVVREQSRAANDTKNGVRRFAGPLAVIAIVVGFFVSGLGWILSSPIGSVPDGDYHMGSIWCPLPAEESCQTTEVNGQTAVLVPEPVAETADCSRHDAKHSGSCGRPLDDHKLVPTLRYDDGNYPREYYRFMHTFIGDDVEWSVIVMRTVNLLIATVLLTVTGFLLPRRYRYAYIVALLAAWMPMGWYYVNSINPSSWSLTGVFVFAVATFASLQSSGKRSVAALGVASIGALLAIWSRGDSAFFLFVCGATLFFAVKQSRWTWPQRAFVALWSLVGAFRMLSSGQASTVSSSELAPRESLVRTAWRGLMDFPQYIADMWGFTRGPGWFDVPIGYSVAALALMGAGGAFMIALARGGRRKWMAGLMCVGAIFGMPLLSTVMGAQPAMIMYQPRYMLPLVAVLFFVLFVLPDDDGPRLSTAQLILFAVCNIGVNTLLLKRVIWRYVSGMVGPEPLYDLNFKIEWWWNLSVSPQTVWMLASLAYGIAVILVLRVIVRVDAHKGEPACVQEAAPQGIAGTGASACGVEDEYATASIRAEHDAEVAGVGAGPKEAEDAARGLMNARGSSSESL